VEFAGDGGEDEGEELAGEGFGGQAEAFVDDAEVVVVEEDAAAVGAFGQAEAELAGGGVADEEAFGADDGGPVG